MRRLFLTISLTTISLGMMAQDITVMHTDSAVTVPADRTNPEFKGGQKALTIFLTKNLRYCKIERFNTTKFSQETESRQKELKKQFALLFAKEGARVIRKMPKWTPGTLNGKAVRVKFDLRISFIDPNK